MIAEMNLPLASVLLLAIPLAAETWSIQQGPNPDSPGKMVLIERDKKPVARFVYGPGQMKPFLHVYGENGELLTNGGLDSQGEPTGQYPHHRGIFIGWKINSELGNYDLWHMNNGGKMEVIDFERLDTGVDSATIVANIAWRAGKSDSDGNDLLVKEKRTLVVSKPDGKRTQVDARFELTPARDLNLAGDLQHSGVHFRAANTVAEHEKDTVYVSEPDSVAKGANLKWCRLAFPIGERWYSATQFNAPSNPVEELSTRNYGRFGYFFKRSIKKGESLDLKYRFAIEPLGLAGPGDVRGARKDAELGYSYFVGRDRS
jgi:hypothetical protein